MSQSDNFKELIPIVINTILPSLSVKKSSTLSRTDGWIKMQTPLLCLVPWEKNISPPHSFLQMFSSSSSEYVSCRKQNLDFWSFRYEKMLLLLSCSLIPLTLIDVMS